MVARRAARGGHAGGPGIPSVRAPRPRLITGALALALAAIIALASSVPAATGPAVLAALLALVALVLLLASLVLTWRWGIGPVVAALGLAYLGHLYTSGASNGAEVALVGVGLLLVGELTQWSFDSRLDSSYESSLHASRAVGLMLLVSLGLGVALLAQIASEIPLAGGLGTVVAGTAAAVGLLGLIARVALMGPRDR